MASKQAERERRDDYEGFSAWLRDAMRRHGYEIDRPRAGGQLQLATDAGLTAGAISKWMSGKGIPQVEAMVKLAPHLGSNVREMLLKSGRVLEEDLVESTGNPIVDPMLDRIYAMEYLPIEVRKRRADDFLRRVNDARRLAELELESDIAEFGVHSTDSAQVQNGS